MDQHPVPRQVTTFEFKLIGFLTVKQFLYLVVFAGLGALAYFLTPVPIMNYVVGLGVFFLGITLTLVKYNERPLDVWLKNLIRRLIAPSQYSYQKTNISPAFLDNQKRAEATQVNMHVDAQQKLSSYLNPVTEEVIESKKKVIDRLLTDPNIAIEPEKATDQEMELSPPEGDKLAVTVAADIKEESTPSKEPFLAGVIKNNKNTAIPGVMVYVKNPSGQTVRILKTNKSGVFATFHKLPIEIYTLEAKDLSGRYFFDTMNLAADDPTKGALIIHSKEIL